MMNPERELILSAGKKAYEDMELFLLLKLIEYGDDDKCRKVLNEILDKCQNEVKMIERRLSNE